MFTDPLGISWMAGVDAEGQLCVWHATLGLTGWSAALVIESEPIYSDVGITGDGRVVKLAARRTANGQLCYWYSEDWGTTWSGPTTVI